MSDFSAQDLLLPLPGLAGRYQVRVRAGAPAGSVLPLAFDIYLFGQPAHLALQRGVKSWQLFYLEDQRRQRTVAQLPVAEAGEEQAYSTYQAPFGGVQMAPEVSARVLLAFLTAVHAHLATLGLDNIQLKSFPFAYDSAASALQTQALLQLGYRIQQSEISSHLPLHREFAAGLYHAELLRLRKCERAGFVVEQEPPWLLSAAYDFWESCRREKGHAPLLPLERLQELFVHFPARHFLFSVRDAEGQWAALILAVQVSADILYTFYSGSRKAYADYSPTVLLHQGLHEFGRNQGYRMLDLGTASLADGLNFPLLQFKQHLGAEASLKLTFTR
ncbi:GNAT family N-acetyltransferase [Hymenobacter guriensis]|uniref:GNAT family N-acetyltransferase n=1 Tax=Hymenobacter guriensis TaxID=2793065 RepID=A0ABS0L0L6_9BACT|nr:GNAT family N-acetyltransferase [Hymenobacter guriensis]MBG8553655.1 GNAT family N-acetyltransferase [Hymenobacter guriensis]